MTNTAAKTPGVAIARVLRGLGLVQGTDFRIKGRYVRGERVATQVIIRTRAAHDLVADNADRIEAMVQMDGGFYFGVSIHHNASGYMWTALDNGYGMRIRETAPAVTKPTAVAQAVTTQRPARRAQKLFGSLTWTCAEAGLEWFFQNTSDEHRYTLRRYRGLADEPGWHLCDSSGGSSFAGRSLTTAALAVEGIYLNDRREALNACG